MIFGYAITPDANSYARSNLVIPAITKQLVFPAGDLLPDEVPSKQKETARVGRVGLEIGR